ncbi:MAG: hypothetical protein ACOYEP_08765 [Limnochordia bacterium]
MRDYRITRVFWVIAVAVILGWSLGSVVWADDLSWIRSLNLSLVKDRYFLLNPEVMEALEDLNSIMDKDVAMWVASMYDPDTGGFYYARSAIGRDGFAADIESTGQALNFMRSHGMFNDMPPYIRQKMIAFFQSRQDPVTGYFFDPQFGSNVSNAKRSRNLSQAVGALRNLGAEPLYPLPYSKERQASKPSVPSFLALMGYQRLGNASPYRQASLAQPAPAGGGSISTLPEYLRSPEALRRWLESFDWENRPWSAGHNVSSARSEITQVGLLDVVYEFIEEIQNPETGLWGPGRTLEEVSAAMKLSGYYASGRPYPNAEKMIESTIYAIVNDTPKSIVHVRNPVDLLATVIRRGGLGYDPDIEALLHGNMPRMIKGAKESLLRFKQPDGAFSYLERGSSPTSQGATVSLGLPEADMNGTMAGANATINYLYELVGISRPTLARYSKEFWDAIVNMKPHERIEVPIGLEDDFDDDDGTLSWVPSSGPGTFGVVPDPHDSENKVLRVQKLVTGSGYSVARGFEAGPESDTTRISLRFMTSEFAPGGGFNLYFGSGAGGASRALSFMIAHQEGQYFLSHRTTEKGYGTRISEIVPDKWYQLDVEYKPAGKDDTELIVYLDGERVKVLNEYFHGGDESKLPIRDIKHASFYVYVNAAATLHVDDIRIESE